MRKCCRNQMVKNGEVLETIKLVDKLVSQKMKSMNVVLPILVATITPILAYLFTKKFNPDQMLGVAIIIIYALIICAILLVAYFPMLSKRLKKTKIKRTKGQFFPSNLTHSAYLSDDDFVKAYETYFSQELSSDDRIAVMLLKKRINELHYQTKCLSWAFGMLIVGVIVVVVTLIVIMVKGVG